MQPVCSFLFAHPDDETFAVGGTIPALRARHIRIDLVCATRGEEGSCGSPPVCSREELPAVREKELRRAAAILGVDRLTLLDYVDKTLVHLPEGELAGTFRAHLEQVRPDWVITFPPSGISGHPDHQAVQRAALAAVQSLTFPTSLYYVVIPESAAGMMQRRVAVVPDETVHTRIDVRRFARQVAEALKAHRTQHQSVASVFPGVLENSVAHLPAWNHYQLAWDGGKKKALPT